MIHYNYRRVEKLRLLQLLLRGVSLVVSMFVLATGFQMNLAPFSIGLILFINIYQLYLTRTNALMIMIMLLITYSNYSILYANFISPSTAIYASEITKSVTTISLNILLLFNCLMFLFTNWKGIKPLREIGFIEKTKQNGLVLFLISIMLVIVFLFGFERPSFAGMRGSPKPIYEYSLSLFLVFFYYCGNNKLYKQIGLFFTIMFALQNFVFGGRILGIQFLLCAYFVLYLNRISQKYLIIITFVALVLMNIIGILRGALLYGIIDFGWIIRQMVDNGFALDTAYAAYYTSEAFVYVHEQIGIQDRLELFRNFLIGILFGSEKSSVIQYVVKDYVMNNGGGIIPHFFFFYLGAFGVFVANLLVAFYLKIVINLNRFSSGILKCIGVYVVCHVFRWYLYTPLGLLRGVLFLLIVFYSMDIVHRLTKQRFT